MNRIALFSSTIVAAFFLAGCGGGLITQNPQYPPAYTGPSTNDYVIAPTVQAPLEAVRDSGLPYAGPLAGVALSILGGIATTMNQRRRRKEAEAKAEQLSRETAELEAAARTLTENVNEAMTASNSADGIIAAKGRIKERQRTDGTRETIKRLLDN